VQVPVATPVTNPEVALTVAIAVELLDHAFVPVVALDNKVVLFTQTVVVPVISDITGNGFTVITLVTAKAHEFESVKVKVIVDVPGATPVTTPELETVATAGVEEVHAPPAVPALSVNVIEPVTQTLLAPVNVPAGLVPKFNNLTVELALPPELVQYTIHL
jgi:hypothetical protein